MKTYYLQLLTYCLLLTGLPIQVYAGLNLNNDRSTVSLVTTKALHTTEVNQFNQLSGTVNDKGNASLMIDLSSIDTRIAIRDERIKSLLFMTHLYPYAVYTTTLPLKRLIAMKPGDSVEIDIKGNLVMRNIKHPVDTRVLVVKLSDGSLQATSIRPIVIKADEFSMLEGVEKLRKLAGLPNISHGVSVMFHLNYQ